MEHQKLFLSASVLSVGITTTMDATGLGAFSALPLLPLAVVLVLLGKYNRKEVGFTLGNPKSYIVVLAYPIVTALGISAIAWFTNAVTLEGINWSHSLTRIAQMFFGAVWLCY